MNTLWRKAARDLRSEGVRSVTIVLALAIGIAGFLAVLSSYAILTRALNDGYNGSNPPSATLEVDRLDDDLVRSVAAMPGILGAEARRTVRGRIKTGPARWGDLVLFSRRDFQASRIGTLTLQAGAWPKGAGEIGVERDALQVARANIGDDVTIRTETGEERSLRVVGSIHDVGQAQARMENKVYGYAAIEALAALGVEPYHDEIAIRVADRPLDERHIHHVANAVKDKLVESGRRVTRIDVPEPGQHPHAKLMGALVLSIAVFGSFVLALSGVIVFNVLTALLAGQTRQIGVMKALGGTRLDIARVYLIETGLLGIAAIAVALPMGLLGGRWLCQWMAKLLNFDIQSFAVPPWIFALVLAIGVAVPVIAAIIPVWLGTRVPVREALGANAASGRVYGTSIVDRALASVGGRSRILLLAIRNTGRNRLRVALTLATLAAGGVFFMSALNVRRALTDTVDRFYERTQPDLSVTLASDAPLESVERAAIRIRSVSVAEGWIVVDGAVPSEDGEARRQDDITVIGLPPVSRTLRLDLPEGQGLDGEARSVVVNTALFDRLGRPDMGSEVRLRIEGREVPLRLSGVAHAAFSPPSAYVSRRFFDDRRQAGTANRLRLTLASPDSASLDSAKQEVEASLAREGIRVVEASTKAESRLVIDEHMVMIYAFLLVVSGILGGIGTLGLLTTVSLNVTERRREMGVLRAIGASPARAFQIVVLEGMVVGAMAWLAATAAVMPMSQIIGNLMLRSILKFQTEIAIAVEPGGVVIWFAAAIAGSALASLWPARKAARTSVREALTYE